MQRPELQLASVHSAQLAAPGCLAATNAEEVCLTASSSALLSLHLPSGSVETRALGNSVKALGCLAYSPAARCVAVGETGFKPAVFVSFQGATSPPLALRAHNFGIQAVAWSPQGTLLASTGVEKDRQLILWHPLSGAQLGRARLEEDYQCLEWVDDRTLCAINSEAFTVYLLEKTVSIGRTQQYKLIPKRHPLSLPTDRASGGSGKVQPGVVSLVGTQPVVGAPRRLWAALDSGHVLALRSANGKCDRVLDTKVGRLVHMAACPQYVACASAGGEIRVLNAASLEEVATLTCPNLPPDYPLHPAAVSCAFSPDGSHLAALFANGTLCSWRYCSEGVEAVPLGSTMFHSSPIVDAALLRWSSQQYVASCGQDGKVQLLQLEGGKLSKAVTVDLRVLQPELRGVRLSSIAASPDGSLLATGDTMGGIHAFAASPGSLDYLCSVEGRSEVTACAFAPPLANGPQRYQLLAVGTQAGTLTLLDAMQDFAVVAQLPQASQGMVSLMWAQQQGSQLLAASRDGKVSAYSVRLMGEGRASLSLDLLTSFRPALPKPPLVAAHMAVWGQVAAACGRDGSSIRIFDAVSGDDLVSVPLEAGKTAGEATSMAVDEGICIAVLASNKNMLQLHDRRNGKLLLASKAHLAGTAVTRVLITPGADSIVTAGQDGSVRVWVVPEELRLECQAEQERLRATVDVVTEEELPPPTTMPSTSPLSEHSSLLRPQNLFDEDTAMSLPTPGDFLDLAEAAAYAPVAMAGGSGMVVEEEAEWPSDGTGRAHAEAAGPQEEGQAEHQQTSQLPRPVRNQSMGGLNRQFGELQAQFQALKASPGRRHVADGSGSGQATAQNASSAIPQPGAQPQASPALSAGCGLSLAEYLRSPRGSGGALSLTSQPGAAGSQLGSASSGLGLQRTASRHQPWLSPREGSGLWVPLSGEEDEIAAAEAQRCKALLRCSEEEPEVQQEAVPNPADVVQQQAAASLPPAATAGGGTSAVPCPESVGSVPTAARQPRRGSWAFGPNGDASTAPRRPLSALGVPATAVCTKPSAPRPATAQGIESPPPPSEEGFTCWSDPSSPAASGFKRQSFSFNMAGAAAAKGAQAAGPSFPCATASEASTPSWGFKTAVSKHPNPTPASISKPLFHSPAAKPAGSSGPAPAGGTAMGAAAACAVRPSSGGLKGRPPVPRLNLPLPACDAEEGASSPTAFEEYEELPGPAEHSGSRGSYATASSSESRTSSHSSSRSSSEGSVASAGQAGSEERDVFDLPLPSAAPDGHPQPESAEEHGDTPFSPPTLHENQLFDSPFHSTSSPASPPAQHVSFHASQQPAWRSTSDGGSDLSAFDRPPAYDPFSPGRHSSSQGTQDEVAKELFDGGSESQAGSPYCSPGAALPGVDMASNPAFAMSPDTSPPLAGPAMRRMSACMPGAAGITPPAIAGEASSPSLPAAVAASRAITTAAVAVTPKGVLAMFSQAVAGLRALQAEGKAEGGFMQQLAQLGISFEGVCGSGVKGSPRGSQPSEGGHRPLQGQAKSTPGSGRHSVLSVEDRAMLVEGMKEEILSELRREILMGALKA